MKLVTDANLIAQLEGGQPAGGKAVTDPVTLAKLDYDLDLTQPTETVRASIGKMQGPQREGALKLWADHFVAQERAQGGIGMAADNTARTISRGSFIGPFLDELNAITGKGLQVISGGRLGSDYDEALAYQRARDRAVDRDYPAASVAGQIAGGLAGGIGALRTAGTKGIEAATGRILAGGPLAAVTPAATLPRNMAQGAGVGAIYGTAAGFGGGEGGLEQRLAGAQTGGAYGLATGAALPPAIAGVSWGIQRGADALSPQIARYGTNIDNLMQRYRGDRPPASLSAAAADGGALPPISGAEAAADQIIANQLSRAGVPASQLQQRLTDAAEAARFHSNSRAQNMLAPVDLDPSLQRLAGSTARQQPEAGNIARDFISGRQTGITPQGRLPDAFGVPTRAALSQASDRPMGQFERVRDAFKRALLIRDEDFHGHGGTAYQTEKQILARAKANAQTLYGETYKAGQNFDLRPAIEPVMQKWATRAADEPGPVASAIRGALRLFQAQSGPVTNIERFDKAKQFLDGRIEKLFDSVEGRNRYLGGVLSQMKNELLAEVDKISANGLGSKYAAARAEFGSNMEMRAALRLGQSIFKDDAEVAVDQFRELATAGQQKLARLGALSGYEKMAARRKRTDDITQIFENPRIQEILQEIIPRTETATGRVKAGAVFADRPERFGRYLGNEKSMIGTRNEVVGNSKTAERLADDAAFNSMSGIIDEIRRSPTITALAFKGVEKALDRLFGFRADTAAFIARKLFTADPGERERLIRVLEQRMGANRTEQLTRLLSDYQRQVTQAGSIVGGGQAGQQRQ